MWRHAAATAAAAAAAVVQGRVLRMQQQQHQQLGRLGALAAPHNSGSSSSMTFTGSPMMAAAVSSSSTAAAASPQQPSEAFLASLVDYEKLGIPKAAGVADGSSSSNNSSSRSNSFDLQPMHQLLATLGNPHHQLKAVHVAGTKGKGSVVLLLSAILRAAGLRVGTYTSPHLMDIRERVTIGGGSSSSSTVAAAVTEEQWAALALQVEAAVKSMQEQQQVEAVPSSSSSSSSSSRLPSHFEVITAMAFQYFAQQQVDIAVIETGLGGATDATNVFTPAQLQAAVLTAVGMDHVEALGGSLETIATAKAGIMRHGVPVIVGPQQQQQRWDGGSSSSSSDCPTTAAAADGASLVYDVFSRTAAGLQCPLVAAETVVQVHPAAGCPHISILQGTGAHLARQTLDITADLTKITNLGMQSNAGAAGCTKAQQQQQQRSGAMYSTSAVLHLPRVEVQLVGRHQADNVATAVTAALLLQQRGWPSITAAAIQAGLQQAWLPGRFQVAKLAGDPPCHVVLDGAHTGDSAAALAATLRAAFPHQPLVLLLAMAADKQHREVCQALRAARPNVVVFTSVPIAGSSHRAAPPGTLAAHWQAAAMVATGRPMRCRELIQANMGAALEKARHELRAFGNQEHVVLVTGSLHAVAAAMKSLHLE